jgi:uncharacterized protein (DUF433 family)
MRIRVKVFLAVLAEGATAEEILADFPDLQSTSDWATKIAAKAPRRKAESRATPAPKRFYGTLPGLTQF